MGKKPGRRRFTARALVRERQQATGGIHEVCDGCGQVVPFAAATYFRTPKGQTVYCRPCASQNDPYGLVQALWDNSEWAPDESTPEREREGGSLPPGVLYVDQPKRED